MADLKSSKKQKSISRPRQIAMFLCREHTCYPFTEIARKFGGRNHSTVVHAVKNIERKMKEGPYIFNAVSEISPGAGKKLGSTASKLDSAVSWQLNFND